LKVHPLLVKPVKDEEFAVFLESLVWASWGSNNVLKSLQYKLCSFGAPFIPPKHPDLVHCINLIVSTEEADDYGTKDPK